MLDVEPILSLPFDPLTIFRLASLKVSASSTRKLPVKTTLAIGTSLRSVIRLLLQSALGTLSMREAVMTSPLAS